MGVFDLKNNKMLKAQRPVTISTLGLFSAGVELAAMAVTAAASTAVAVNNVAWAVPFRLTTPMTVKKLYHVNGSVATGNIDMGIYDEALARLVSIGSTAQSGTNIVQEFDITDTQLNPGLYYIASAYSSSSATAMMPGGMSGFFGSIIGAFTATTSFPLPSTLTPANAPLTIPIMGLTNRVFVI